MKTNKTIISNAIIFVVNHMHFGGCQKIVYEIIKGVHKHNKIILISKPGYYSEQLIKNTDINFIERINSKPFSLINEFIKIKRNHSKIILHTHNRNDILLKFFLRNQDIHIHTFHSAYLDKNYIYKYIKPQYAVSISKTVQNYLLRFNIESILIYNGVNVDQKGYNNKNNYNRLFPKILYVGRLSNEKGIQELLEALNEFKLNTIKSLNFDIIGDGVLKNTCEDYINSKKSNFLQVNFKGYNTNPWEHVEEYDLLIIPSIFEGFCLVGVEASVIGIPIIASDIYALKEVLSFLPNECFFDPNNKESIQKTLSFALTNRNQILTALKDNKETLTETFSLNLMVKKYADVYKAHSQLYKKQH